MSEKKDIKIKPAKGRPMLSWVGKRPLKSVTAFPAQHIETFDPVKSPAAIASPPLPKGVNRVDPTLEKGGEGGFDIWKDWPDAYLKGGLLFHGDNKEVLAHLLANGFRGKVNLIYIDPPFDSGADYVRKVQLRGISGTAKIDGETYNLGEQIQYTDIWANDNYLQFMYERLMLLKELLSESGSIWLHCDPSRSHYLKLVLDEIFGTDKFINEIIWRRSAPKGLTGNQFPDNHDVILYYCKDRNLHQWQKTRSSYTEEHLAKFRYVEEGGRKYMMDNVQNPNPNRPNLTYEWNGHLRCWRWTKEKMQAMHDSGRLAYAKNGMPYLKRYLDEIEGPTVSDTWIDIAPINSQAIERENYPTQKPEEVVERVLESASNPGDIILDSFIGSGTTAAVAQKLGRKWIGCDINKGAIQTTSKRLQTIIREQVEAEKNKPLTLPLSKNMENSPQSPFSKVGNSSNTENSIPPLAKGGKGGFVPAQTSFTIWRVNDYDLQIQHNEAVNLACEHIGIERTRSDRFFEGNLNKKLVKIIPFNHPLSPLDLEEIRRELEARPDEDRHIVVVCLGKELSSDLWLEDWNRVRKGRDAINKIEVIELRTDPKFGKFISHQPATAKVSIKRIKDKIKVDVEDFISPTIIERLEMDTPVFKAKITDWRSMVDCIMIDTAYNGKFFNVTLSDVPERKTDLVNGSYELPAPKGETTVAVKIIDMLGEEVIEIKKV